MNKIACGCGAAAGTIERIKAEMEEEAMYGRRRVHAMSRNRKAFLIWFAIMIPLVLVLTAIGLNWRATSANSRLGPVLGSEQAVEFGDTALTRNY